MSFHNKIALAKQMLESAVTSLRSAQRIINELAGNGGCDIQKKYEDEASNLEFKEEENVKIIEGIFDGQTMIGPNGKNFPVPANYASKSKLVPGDVLKLSISENGNFVYKQIGPVERARVTGPLTREDGQYKVIANGKTYKVLLASVTYFKAEIGDDVTLVIPEDEESEWGAIENVIPKLEEE